MSGGNTGGSKGGNVFDASAGQYAQSSGILSQLGQQGGALSQIGQPGGVLSGIGQAGSTIAQIGQPGGVLSQLGQQPNVLSQYNQPGSIAQSMNAYINPFQNQVIDSAVGRLTQDRDISLNQVGAQAEAASAFGGSRHGLVESEIYSNTNRNIGELAGNLGLQGFNTAAQFGNLDIQNRLQGTSLAGTFANRDNQNLLQALGLGSSIAGQDVNSLLQSIGMGGNFTNQDIQNRMAAAGGLSGLADQGFGFGQSITQQQAQQGAQQQQLAQNVISGGNQQFDALMNSPQDALNTQLAALAGNPLMGENTQSYTPGIYDYISLLLQTAGQIGQGAFQ